MNEQLTINMLLYFRAWCVAFGIPSWTRSWLVQEMVWPKCTMILSKASGM